MSHKWLKSEPRQQDGFPKKTQLVQRVRNDYTTMDVVYGDTEQFCRFAFLHPRSTSFPTFASYSHKIVRNLMLLLCLRIIILYLDSACLEDKGLFRSANILQIADVVRRVLLLLCFRQWFVVKRAKCFTDFSAIFLFTTKTIQPRPQVFLVNGALTFNSAALLTSSVH